MTTTAEMESIANKAADAAVDRLLLRLGIDPENPDDVSGLKADLQHLRSWRTATQTVSRTAMVVAVGTVITAILGAIWLTIKTLIAAASHPS